MQLSRPAAGRSRSSLRRADWQRLLQNLCLANTLILDGVYDSTSFNDRLLLGLKGTMSEGELHVMKARLRGGILNKVRRCEYRCALPKGLIYDRSGDPDLQIRETIVHFFDACLREKIEQADSQLCRALDWLG